MYRRSFVLQLERYILRVECLCAACLLRYPHDCISRLGTRERFVTKAVHSTWISTYRVQDLHYVKQDDNGVSVGAALTIQQLADALAASLTNMKKRKDEEQHDDNKTPLFQPAPVLLFALYNTRRRICSRRRSATHR